VGVVIVVPFVLPMPLVVVHVVVLVSGVVVFVFGRVLRCCRGGRPLIVVHEWS